MSVPIFVSLIAAILILPIVGTILFFRMRSRDSIMSKYEGTEASRSVFVKTYTEASIPYYRTVFMLTGFAVSLAVLLMGFNYMAPVKTSGDLLVSTDMDDEIEDIPVTNQTPPPPPPPPPPPEVIEVEDDEEIDDTPEIFEQEFDERQVIEEPVYVEPEAPKVEVEEPDFFVVVEDMPEYPGGEGAMYKWLGKNIKYPQVAKENGIEGKVFVRFIVDQSGKVRDASVVRGIGGGCDEEALRVVNMMPDWKPGKQRGKPVRVQFTIPIHFQLN